MGMVRPRDIRVSDADGMECQISSVSVSGADVALLG